MAADLFEDCFTTATARPFMAQLLTNMVATLQEPSALTSAYVLSLETVINRSWGRIEWTLFSLGRLSLNGFSLAWAAALVTGMTATIEGRST